MVKIPGIPDRKSGGSHLSKRARTILTRLAEGAVATQINGEITIGGHEAGADLATLIAHDLVARERNGGIEVTAPGRAYLKRQQSIAAARRAAVASDLNALGVLEPYRDQHGEIEATVIKEPGEKPSRRFVNRRECPLAWLHRRRDRSGKPMVNASQFEAGMRLRNDFERGGLSPRVTSSWSALPTGRENGSAAGRQLDPTDAQLSARVRFRRAVQAMGPGLAETAIRVCCTFEGLEEVEKSQNWPARSGKVVLGLALSRLADYYDFGKK